MEKIVTTVVTGTDSKDLQTKINYELEVKADKREFIDIKFSTAYNGGSVNYTAIIIFKIPVKRHSEDDI